jgi:Putative capsular polysaccharide synthesis protein
MQIHQSPLIKTVNSCPIIIYQMGKVGSETILTSLEKLTSLDNPIYHIHVLATQNMKKSVEHLKTQGIQPTLQLQHSQIIRAYLDENTDPELKVITAVREPISQFISAFFQNIRQDHPSFLNTDGSFNQNAIENHLMRSIETYNPETAWNCNWFDRDFYPALNINVYEHEFAHQQGYDRLLKSKKEVLILRLESSNVWEDAITDFLKLDRKIELYKTNAGSTKDYNTVYRDIQSKLKFKPQTLKNIYNSKYCQHFYTDEMIQKFIKQWSL